MRKSFTHEGKRHYIRAKDMAEYEVKKALKLKDLEEGKIIESKMLVRDWAKEWMETYKSAVLSDEQYKDYNSRLNRHILPVIGHIRLKDVKPIHLQKIMLNITGLSGSRIKKISQCLNQLFKAAKVNGLISENPFEGVEVPKGEDGTHRAITDQERKVLLEVTATHKYGLWAELMLYCGLRPCETATVKPSHFDYKKKMLYVDGTKSDNAVRYVPAPDNILERVSQSGVGPFEYLFVTNRGTPLNKQARRRRWNAICRAMHIQMGGKLYRNQIIPPFMVADDLTAYCLRHTFCTDLQDAGVPINVARDLMGHSDISLTSKIYTHTTDRAIECAANLLEEYRKVAR